MPSREHFLLNLLKALSTDSFSPTLIVDTVFTSPFQRVAFHSNAYKLYQSPQTKVNRLRAQKLLYFIVVLYADCRAHNVDYYAHDYRHGVHSDHKQKVALDFFCVL